MDSHIQDSGDIALFTDSIRRWIIGFHGDIAPLTEEMLEQRVRTYVLQEELYREKVNFLLHLLPRKPHLALDVGSSAGGFSVALGQRGVMVYGIEPSPAGVEASIMRANRLGLGNVHFQQAIGEAIPFPDNTFDVVTSLAVLEHVHDVDAVIGEAYRVLKPGGWIYFEVPNNIFPFEGHYKMIWLPMMPKPLAKIYVRARGAYPEFLDHLHYMNRLIISRCLRKAGFNGIKDVYGTYLAGKASGAVWARRSGRLYRLPWCANIIRLIFDAPPTAWFMNRAVYMLAMKPDNCNDHEDK